MDLQSNNQLFTLNTTTESPYLNLETGNSVNQERKLMGDTD